MITVVRPTSRTMCALRVAVGTPFGCTKKYRLFATSAAWHLYNQQASMVREIPPPPKHVLDKEARVIFNAAVKSVLPQNMVKNSLSLDGNLMCVANRTYNIKNGVYIVGFGKAVLGMVKAAEDILGDKIIGGIASVPHGITDTFRKLDKTDMIPSSSCKVKIMEGAANNYPDNDAFQAAMEIEELLERLKEGDTVLTLTSGGGSALLPYPTPPITLEEMATVTRLLSRKGVSIQELNTVRKHLEVLKGGGLAKTADPAEMVNLIVSDVVGDDLDYIASGPTVPDLFTPGQSLALIKQLKLEDKMPESVLSVLHSKEITFRAERFEGHGSGFPRDKVNNLLIGTNQMALDAAKLEAENLGYIPVILTSALTGDVREATAMFTKLTRFLLDKLFGSKSLLDSQLPQTHSNMEFELIQCGVPKSRLNEISTAAMRSKNSNIPICILVGGETTVDASGDGRGGRSQQMALEFAMNLHQTMEKSQVEIPPLFLSAGTDGQDGPTDAAGACVDCNTVSAALEQGLVAEDYLKQNDSYAFFSELNHGSCHIKTGLTGTNVMDIQMILIHPNKVF